MENKIISELGLYGLIPVVVLQKLEQALPLADAYTQAGLPVMEITLRTDAGLPAIKLLHKERPDVLIGAGTVLSLEQCRFAVEYGASFIVTPGFNTAIVEWCIENEVCIIPGCVTPSEINAALSFGLNTVKFFPANVYGGYKACEALSGPFASAGVRFIPTGGICLENLAEYSDKDCIFAVGGGWLCDKKLLNTGDYDKLRDTARDSVNRLLGFEMTQVDVQNGDGQSGFPAAETIHAASSIGGTPVLTSDDPGPVKSAGMGKNGSITIKTNSLPRAVFYLGKRGYKVDEASAEHKNGNTMAVYLKNEISGLTIHLLQKQR